MAGAADLAERVQRFVAAVRAAGVPAGPDRVQVLLGALDVLGPGDLYWAGRLTLCGSREDLHRYDAAWREWGRGPDHSRRGPVAPRAVPVGLPPAATPAAAAAGPEDAGTGALALAYQASAREHLRRRDLAALTAAERAEVRRLLSLLAPGGPRRLTRRSRPARTGGVDPHRTLRATLRGLGEPSRLAWRRRRVRPRRLVLLVDVSGSMAPYADGLLRFAHAAVRVRPAVTEVFTIGTRLTRVTTALRRADPDLAVRAAGEQIPDWRGGTQLGEALTAYLRGFGHRGMARRAVVVICSDGWESGDARALGRAMAWLGRLAHRVVWVSPHAERPGFAPTTAGLAAAWPYLDRLVAGHSLAALADLAELLRER